MLTDRDNAVISFLDDFEVATTSQLHNMFFSNVSLRYCQVRLNKLVEYKELKRVRTHIDQEYLYCVDIPKQLKHFFIRTNLYFECLKYYTVDQWVNRLQIGKVMPDGYCQLVDHNICFGLFIEVHRSNNIFNQTKYENLYLSGLWKERFNSFPRVLVVTDKNIKLAPSKIKFRVIDINFNGLDKIFGGG